MTTRWIINDEVDEEIIAQLSSEININSTVAKILIQRGVTDFDLAKEYFRPTLDQLHDPFLMRDMTKAIGRIKTAIEQNEKILIYGDYDVDGTTSVALVYGFLSNFYPHIDFYIPDRYKEGYGVSKEGIDFAKENNFSLIITLDCGIKAIGMTDYANTLGVDLIICDHHLPGDILPNAIAILDPKLNDCPYPFKELSGCGVGFKLIQAFCHDFGYDPDLLFDYLDLVAVSIAADIVPVVNENRVLAFYGLKKLNENPRPGLEALIKLSGNRKKINISGIVFGIGPRINASGRIDHAKTAVELMLAENSEVVEPLAKSLDVKNLARRSFDSTITAEALEMIESGNKDAKSTVLYKDDWHKGVIGIVASRCIEKFYRPTIILTKSNGKATGSARSVNGFNVYKAISECSNLLEQYGGHMYAAGLTMDIKNVDAFKEKFEQVVSDEISEEQLIPLINIDCNLDLNKIDYKFYNLLEQMEPFGPGNMQPLFVTTQLHVTKRPRILKNLHLKFSVKQNDEDDFKEVIGFGLAEYYDLIASGMRFSMAYYIEENDYLGNKSLQLRAVDIRFD